MRVQPGVDDSAFLNHLLTQVIELRLVLEFHSYARETCIPETALTGAVLSYRFYILNAAGHINGCRVIEASGDEEARRVADALGEELAVPGYEVWDRDRQVAVREAAAA